MGEVKRSRFAAWRGVGVAVVVTLGLAVAGCGGGGGGGEDTPATASQVQGEWQLQVTLDNDVFPAVAVPASAVPSEEQFKTLNTADIATVVATHVVDPRFQITVNGAGILLAGPGTNYTLEINNIQSRGNYQGCGNCAAGSHVSFAMLIAYGERGTLDNQVVPITNDSFTLGFNYTRVR